MQQQRMIVFSNKSYIVTDKMASLMKYFEESEAITPTKQH